MTAGMGQRAGGASGSAHLFLREEEMRLGYEDMLRAGRELAQICEDCLQQERLGPAHQRVLFLIATHPGITMSGLLAVLAITKQSLNRVLQELVERGFVERRTKAADLRLKLLHLTETGATLEARLFDLQRERMTKAYREAGGQAVDGFRRVLALLVEGSDRI